METKQPLALQAKPLAGLSKHTMVSSSSSQQQLLPSLAEESQEAAESCFHSWFSLLSMGTCSLPEASLGGSLLREQTRLPGQSTLDVVFIFHSSYEPLGGKTEKSGLYFSN